MARFPRELIRQVAESVSMVELVRRHVDLKRKGNQWAARCPFHEEKSPSFYVSEQRKSYHCFGCGAHGDALKWLQEMEGLEFLEAMQTLADQAGIPLPKEELSPSERARNDRRQELLRANEVAARFFAEQLQAQAGGDARAEIERRGVPAELVKSYRLGFAPDSWDALIDAFHRARVPAELGEEAGLLVPRKTGSGHYDRFRNRLVFPIRDAGGKVVAFGGRRMADDDSAKYINSPESPVYRKSQVLYGLHEARRHVHRADRALIVEGYFDVLGLAKAGLGNALAPCGTALTVEQLKAVKRHTERIVLFFDGDAAGQQAAFRALQRCLEAGLWPVSPSLPDGMDPDDFVRERGAEAMNEVVAAARPLMDVYLDGVLDSIAADPHARKQQLESMLPVLAAVPPELSKPYRRRVSTALMVDEQLLDRRLQEQRRRRAPQSGPPRGGGPGGPPGPSTFGSEPDFPPFADDDVDEPVFGPPPSELAPGPPAAPPNPAELKLLKVLVQDLGEVAPLMDDVGALGWLQHPDVAAVAGRLMRAWRDGREPLATEVVDGVADRGVRLQVMADLTSDREHYGVEILERATRECLIRLHLDHLDRRIGRIQLEIDRLHSRGGGLAEARELLQERQELQRERADWNEHLRTGHPDAGLGGA